MDTRPNPSENASEPLTNAEKAELRRRASRHEPIVRVGHAGVTEALLRSLDEALSVHELVKIRFAAFKDQKKLLAPQIARQTGSELISRVGNVAIYFRRKDAPRRPAEELPASDLTPSALD